jgi:hypothetical protein
MSCQDGGEWWIQSDGADRRDDGDEEGELAVMASVWAAMVRLTGAQNWCNP